jgi:hypothetical protein
MKFKFLTPYTFSKIETFYQTLLQNQEAVEKIGSFLLRYRLVSWGQETNVARLLRELYKKKYLRPLHSQLFTGKESEFYQTCFDTLINALVKSADANKENWSIALILDQYRRGLSWRHRPILNAILEEHFEINNFVVTTNARKEMTSNSSIPVVIQESMTYGMGILRFNDFLSIKQIESTRQHLTEVKKNLAENLPGDFCPGFKNKVEGWTLLLFILSIIYLLSRFFYQYFSGNIEINTLPLALLIVLAFPQADNVLQSSLLTSPLEYKFLEPEFQAGLATDLQEEIQQILGELRRQLPHRSFYQPKSESDLAPLPQAPGLPANVFSSELELKSSAECKHKAKRHPAIGHLQWTLPLPPATYTWETKHYGTLRFQIGRPQGDMFLLSGKTSHTYSTVVLFNRNQLEKDKYDSAIIQSFYNLVRAGHRAAQKNEPGFKNITSEEKRKNNLSENTTGKFKSLSRLYGKYRLFCETPLLTTKPQHSWNLLVTTTLKKTH